MPVKSITQSQLKKVFHYDPETGFFTRILSTCNSVKVGDIAKRKKDGYIIIHMNNFGYRAHRLAWLYMTGKFPINQIDHINHIRNDNSWLNLRDVTPSSNQRNATLSKNNKSGFTGVSWHKITSTWRVYISHDNRQISLGYYHSIDDAISARKKGNIKYKYHSNHGN